MDDEESCRVYAGGQVYPQERRTSEHALHWSKAQSINALNFMYEFQKMIILEPGFFT